MTSTAIDAIVAIVIVGAAITTLLTVAGPTGDPADPAPTLETLMTSTTTVNYTLTPDPNASSVQFGTEAPTFDRTARGAYAELLAGTILSMLSVDGTPVYDTDTAFGDAVTAATRSAIGADTQVAIVWKPYPDAHLDARVTVGNSPPTDADVSAATTTVPSTLSASEEQLHTAATTDGYEGVSRVIADRIVAGTFPPDETRLALRGGPPTSGLIAHRYYQFGDAYGVDVGPPVRAYRPALANERLADELADRVEADLREQFDSPIAAARAVELDRVQLVVRRWN